MRAGESNAVIELSVLVRQGPQQCHYRGSLEAGFRAGKITATVLSRHRQEERPDKKDSIHIGSPFLRQGWLSRSWFCRLHRYPHAKALLEDFRVL